MPLPNYLPGDPRNNPSYGCEEMGLSEFINADCASYGALFLDKLELSTALILLLLALVILFAPSFCWYRWRRKVASSVVDISFSEALSQFELPDEDNELWAKCLVAERGDRERAKYAYVDALAQSAEKQGAISLGWRAVFIVSQFVLTAISFGLVRDILGGGEFFVSGIGGLAILYFATSKGIESSEV